MIFLEEEEDLFWSPNNNSRHTELIENFRSVNVYAQAIKYT